MELSVVVALLTLTALEIVLGIDNVVFIAVLAQRLPAHQRQRARVIGLGLAFFMRIGLLATLGWLIGLTAPLIAILGQELSGRDLILIAGGLFLIAKATFEIHEMLEGEEAKAIGAAAATASFGGVVAQIAVIDAIFSLDSVITAVGMVDEIWIMVVAVMIAIAIMMVSAGTIADLIQRRPTIKMLALSFLLLIGTALVAEGWELHIPKGYIYFAMGFSILVELLNQRIRDRRPVPVALRPTYVKDATEREV